MTLTSAEIVKQVAGYARDLREASDETRRCAIEKADAEHAFRKAHAVFYAKSAGTSHAARDQEADAATIDERRRHVLAEALWKSAVESERSKRAVVSAWQSYVSFAKTEAELARG